MYQYYASRHTLPTFANFQTEADLERHEAYGRFCDVCRLHRKRARYRTKTVRRQSLTVKPSRLSCDEVAARDNYVCHICDGWV